MIHERAMSQRQKAQHLRSSIRLSLRLWLPENAILVSKHKSSPLSTHSLPKDYTAGGPPTILTSRNLSSSLTLYFALWATSTTRCVICMAQVLSASLTVFRSLGVNELRPIMCSETRGGCVSSLKVNETCAPVLCV